MKSENNSMKKNEKSKNAECAILFDSAMRKTFTEGVIQDIKGYFESKTDGKISISYSDYDLKNHEFSFHLIVEKTNACSKQMWSEAVSAIVNVVNYMFPADGMNIDVSISTTEDAVAGSILEVDFTSNW